MTITNAFDGSGFSLEGRQLGVKTAWGKVLSKPTLDRANLQVY
ncbi:hypothetical protein [Limnoraphis robusta]|nr:hypothetical protein [Limnoraphis robusta]MEA5496203.1 hypothetical protein [Limnoraphis robusta BA-68 BA1]MEA5544477.1 hypothetical protein [Limnoraphis robusta CCNP1324]